jgi:ABC exporter DevB family membrane fusion protein
LSRAALILSALAALGCQRGAGPELSAPQAAGATARRIVALGRMEPLGRVVSISALPGERLKNYADGIVEGAVVAAGGELARMASIDLRQTQLDAAEAKLDVSRQQRQQELAAAKAQVEQAMAAQAQAEAKYQETLAQQNQLENLAEASAIAQDDYQRLVELQASDPELATAQQLRRRRNAADRAAKQYETAAASYPTAVEAAKKSVQAAEANLKLARQNAELQERVDPTLAAELERQVAAESLEQSILRAPKVEGGSEKFTVLKILMQPGEFVAQLPVLEIGDLSRMACIAEVYEADAKEIEVGQAATVHSSAFSGEFADGAASDAGGIAGKVVRVSRMVGSPGLTNRNPLAPSDRSVVEVVVAIDPADQAATAEAARHIGLQVTVEFADRAAAEPSGDAAGDRPSS